MVLNLQGRLGIFLQPLVKVMLLDVEDQEDEEVAYEDPTARGECPYGGYPEPRNPIWEFVCTGTSDGWELERDNRTGRYRLHPEGRRLLLVVFIAQF